MFKLRNSFNTVWLGNKSTIKSVFAYLFIFSFNSELKQRINEDGKERDGRKRTSISSKLRECGTCSLLDLICIGR